MFKKLNFIKNYKKKNKIGKFKIILFFKLKEISIQK